MKRKTYQALFLLALSSSLVFGCKISAPAAGTETAREVEAEQNAKEQNGEAGKASEEYTQDMTMLEDGIYTAEFDTDSGMFHVNEANEGRGVLTVKDGEMTLHVSLASKSIVNLFSGTAVEAKKEGVVLLEPTLDTVTYSDGLSEEVYGFDIPVPVLEEPFDLALIGKKGKWYDHKVSVSDPQPAAEEDLERLAATASDGLWAAAADAGQETKKEDSFVSLPDGEYTPDKFSWSGGSGRIELSCTKVTVEDGQVRAVLVFSSDSYAYVKVDGIEYTGTVADGTTIFEIPVKLNENNEIVGMTTKMSAAHEITYKIYIYLAAADGGAKTISGADSVEAETAAGADGGEARTTVEAGSAEAETAAGAGSAEKTQGAPEIAGLEYLSETKLEYANYFKLYNYSGGITLLEVDMRTGTARESAARVGEAAADEEGSHMPDSAKQLQTREETAAELYRADVVRYLIVPENTELPAGLEKEMIIVTLPVENVYHTMEVDFEALVKGGYDLALLPSRFLPKSEETLAQDEEYFEQTTSGFATLGIPLVVDRSQDEETEQGKAEWQNVYDALLLSDGTGEQAELSTYLVEAPNAPQVANLACVGQMKLDFAQQFCIYFYEGDYALLDINESGQFLVVPEGEEVPEGLEEAITVLRQPLDHIYLQATASMALFRALDSLDCVTMTGTQADGWYIEEVVERMESGQMLFAGKYSEPDYELLVDQSCDLALESTMLLHSPKVQEMLELLDIPVLLERTSYETEPLGRTEWIKLYGVLMDKEQEAVDFFEEQKKILDAVADFGNTGKTICFFHVNTDGSVVVRKREDYISRMIEQAGGNLVYGENWPEDPGSASIRLSMEEFYAAARNADYLVYNATIANELGSIEELLAENELFADFKAVQEGNVWTTTKQLFQATDIMGNLITDFHHLLTGEEEMTFLVHVK